MEALVPGAATCVVVVVVVAVRLFGEHKATATLVSLRGQSVWVTFGWEQLRKLGGTPHARKMRSAGLRAGGVV